MPINEKLMSKLQAQYGEREGKSVYFAMEAEGKGPFGAGKSMHGQHLDFAKRHGVDPISTPHRPRTPTPRRR